MRHLLFSGLHSSGTHRTSLFPAIPVLPAVIVLAACEDLRPPVSCDTLEDHTMFVRQSRRVTPCFEDPEMGGVTLSVESSDTTIVTASMVGLHVRIEAISVGSATITVTATDPDLLTTSEEFTVVVPNRPPWRRRRIPDVDLFPEGMSVRPLSHYFADPEEQELSYSATSSDPASVSASLSGDALVLHAVGEGSAIVTVTATDPFGEMASGESTATVRMPVSVFRDDFEAAASLSSWELNGNSDAIVTEGSLRLYNVVAGLPGWARIGVAAKPWRATASVANATDSVSVSLVAGIDHTRYTAYLIQIGPDVGTGLEQTNYRFFVYDADQRSWTNTDGWYGQSEGIAGVGDLTEVTLAVQGGNLTVHAGSTELVRVDLESNGLSDELVYLVLASWPKCCATGHAAVVDWIELDGIPVEGSSMDRFHANADPIARLSRIGLDTPSGAVRMFEPGKPLSRAGTRR